MKKVLLIRSAESDIFKHALFRSHNMTIVQEVSSYPEGLHWLKLNSADIIIFEYFNDEYNGSDFVSDAVSISEQILLIGAGRYVLAEEVRQCFIKGAFDFLIMKDDDKAFSELVSRLTKHYYWTEKSPLISDLQNYCNKIETKYYKSEFCFLSFDGPDSDFCRITGLIKSQYAVFPLEEVSHRGWILIFKNPINNPNNIIHM